MAAQGYVDIAVVAVAMSCTAGTGRVVVVVVVPAAPTVAGPAVVAAFDGECDSHGFAVVPAAVVVAVEAQDGRVHGCAVPPESNITCGWGKVFDAAAVTAAAPAAAAVSAKWIVSR